eukprot:g39372.t1
MNGHHATITDRNVPSLSGNTSADKDTQLLIFGPLGCLLYNRKVFAPFLFLSSTHIASLDEPFKVFSLNTAVIFSLISNDLISPASFVNINMDHNLWLLTLPLRIFCASSKKSLFLAPGRRDTLKSHLQPQKDLSVPMT